MRSPKSQLTGGRSQAKIEYLPLCHSKSYVFLILPGFAELRMADYTLLRYPRALPTRLEFSNFWNRAENNALTS